jgi:hypothetical protein
MGTGRSKSRADDVALCVNAKSKSLRETRREKRVQVYDALRAPCPQQGVTGPLPALPPTC